MNRIDTLHIHNFKFFQSQEPIKLGGKHMLLYGENGSGKSSVYWSLYTLFEASLKESDDQIQKYFSKTLFGGEDCLVNIHAPETAPGSDDFNSFIELVTDDPQPSTYRISCIDLAIRGNPDAKKINYSSDFINYRLLLAFSSFSHSEPINLYNIFVQNIFTYVRFSAIDFTRNGTTRALTSPSEMWEEILKWPNEYNFDAKYTPEELRNYLDSLAYQAYKKSFYIFHQRLQALIDNINFLSRDYLIKLGYNNFDFKLEFNEASYTINEDPDKFDFKPFSIGLIITEYDGLSEVVKKPHSFLNEARFSAIALSIRFAILKQKLHEDCLKFIVLDDLLISLDMSNREKVLEVLLSNEFSTNYQLIILTHDFTFFQLCKRKISDAGQVNWINYEMYVDEDNKLPVILPSDTFYAKGCNHFKNFDYPAAGNYFRKVTEEIFENEFPREVTIADSGEKRTTLKGYLDAAVRLYERIGQSPANLKTLDNYLFLLLNPLSHRAIDTNVYKTELNRVKSLLPKIINEVQSLNFRELIAANNTIVIHFTQNATTEHEYFIRTTEPIYLINKQGSLRISNSKCKSYESSTITNGEESVIAVNEHYNFNNILALHRQIYAFKNRPYDHSHRTNIYHQAPVTNYRRTLQQIVDAL